MRLRTRVTAVVTAPFLIASLAASASADGTGAHDATRGDAAASTPGGTYGNAPEDAPGNAPGDAADLDVLFVGAHPDDEAGALAAFGQWNEFDDVRAGVITVTRGEGGGNAVGLEEGPELGLIREAEERRAVGYAGIERIYNLDKIDFFYTLSAPLTREAWDGDGGDTLERVVRVVRATRPEVIVTMDPSPGNHGNHQEAARLAVEAYEAAADPDAYPEQVESEGLEPWTAARILQHRASGSAEPGPACETTPFDADDPTDRVFGVWAGRMSEAAGERWAMLERRAQWEYVTQGWHTFPPPPEDPDEIACDWFTLIGSRTPYPEPTSGPTAAIEGAVLPADDGLPLGTGLTVDTETFTVLPGTSFTATVQVTAARKPLVRPELDLRVPDGWTVEETGDTPRVVRPGQESSVDVVVTPPDDAPVGERHSLAASITTRDGASGTNETVVETVHQIQGRLAARPEIADFQEWTHERGLPKLETLITPTASVGSGRSEEVAVEVTNDSDAPASGSVTLDLADGFEASPAEQAFDDLAPGATTSVTFEVTNVDTSLPTSSNAPGGGYPFDVVTTVDSTTDVQEAVLELVPTTEVPQVDEAPVLDGVAGEGEYPADELDASTHWEGEEVAAADASASAKVSFTDEALYVFVDVTDDELGNVLPPEDCKRHWRTDSVEITVDPRGTSQHSATTFKTGIFPVTDDPDNGNPPCFQRDADNNQGPGAETAPGIEVASVVRDPYDGYTIEAKIPFDVLPDTVDPERMGFNVLLYDSDTQDNTGQTRIGWSTFGGVQANPFGWGLATLPGLEESAPDPVEPTLPSEAARSVDSPQSIEQAAIDGVPLGGGPGLEPGTLRIASARMSDDGATVRLRTSTAGQANVFVWDGEAVVGSVSTELAGGSTTVEVPLDSAARSGEDTGYDSGAELTALVAFITDGGTAAGAEPVR
ncbi:GlcNAc-PI de-N-acetylase [Actinobacteria bacterium YIM 96077]|uniref:GlcNAc-PI de-N-acetylase n=1 Tax=Phytoactinopolyspora halophila TaxID=1981511 RepID=A0A329QHU0_9ACTN|nr:sugar-binding protein [Phytoactinopolyspora halophila]AYY14116.1 GlcNAc-PI de-N-acetylase [Actinobacteria bacterium YIM 96077]RAW09948.1 GlcNAc-PI de-N-acetylase [Phytoactinopolyspora halophila]